MSLPTFTVKNNEEEEQNLLSLYTYLINLSYDCWMKAGELLFCVARNTKHYQLFFEWLLDLERFPLSSGGRRKECNEERDMRGSKPPTDGRASSTISPYHMNGNRPSKPQPFWTNSHKERRRLRSTPTYHGVLSSTNTCMMNNSSLSFIHGHSSSSRFTPESILSWRWVYKENGFKMSVSLGKQGRRSWKETRETVVTASLWCGFVTFSFGMIGESVYPVWGC